MIKAEIFIMVKGMNIQSLWLCLIHGLKNVNFPASKPPNLNIVYSLYVFVYKKAQFPS